MAHALLRFHDERVVVGTDAVRTVIEARVEGIGPAVRERSVVCLAIGAIVILEHGQMAAQRSLVLGTQEQAAEEFAFHTEVEVLTGGIVHVDVHSADGDPSPRNWDARRQIGGVVRRANGRGIRVKDGISASRRVEIKQRVERRVPGPVRPDVVEDAVIEDTVTASSTTSPRTAILPFPNGSQAKPIRGPKSLLYVFHMRPTGLTRALAMQVLSVRMLQPEMFVNWAIIPWSSLGAPKRSQRSPRLRVRRLVAFQSS